VLLTSSLSTSPVGLLTTSLSCPAPFQLGCSPIHCPLLLLFSWAAHNFTVLSCSLDCSLHLCSVLLPFSWAAHHFTVLYLLPFSWAAHHFTVLSCSISVGLLTTSMSCPAPFQLGFSPLQPCPKVLYWLYFCSIGLPTTPGPVGLIVMLLLKYHTWLGSDVSR
jgi:hypothetical protein